MRGYQIREAAGAGCLAPRPHFPTGTKTAQDCKSEFEQASVFQLKGVAMSTKKNQRENPDLQRDPANPDVLTGQPGAHPLGAGLGAVVGGAVTGAAAGAVAGPVGAVAGTIVGGVAGGYAGKAVAENINPTVESDYWRQTYPSRPYYRKDRPFETLEPAYRIGWESYETRSQPWETREQEVKRKWEENRWEGEGGAVKVPWDEARQAARDAYNRVAERDRNCQTGSCSDEC